MKNIIITGSGRSGTSMAAGLFSRAGYYFGDQYLGKNASNPKGFFEDREVNQINEAVLACVVPSYPEIIRKYFFPSHPFYNARWLARIKPGTRLVAKPHIEQRISERLSHAPFCFKDPRFSYTLPVWLPLMNADTVILCVFREPLKTALSIVQECRDSRALHPLKMNEKIALTVWLFMYRHILDTFAAEADKTRWLFVHFDQILSHRALKKIRNRTGAVLDEAFPEKKISRTRTHRALKNKHIHRVYAELCSLAGCEPESAGVL